MFPALRPGDTLNIDRVSEGSIHLDDVVLFARNDRLFVHRVVEKSTGARGEIVTRGDAMPQADPPLSKSELLGKITSVLRDGTALDPGRNAPTVRAIAALMRRSELATRAVVGVHGILQSTFRIQNNRAVSCQN